MNNVVAAIIKKDYQFLIVQRNRKKHLGLKWEFPGGKVQETETFEEALLREIKEELNITINMHEKIAEEKYKDDKIDIVLHYYLCSYKSGTMKLSEHETFAWVEKKDFYKFNNDGGAVISAAINKYVYIILNKYHDKHRCLLKYSKSEIVKNIKDIKHPLIKACLEKSNLWGLDINSVADIPAGTGLG